MFPRATARMQRSLYVDRSRRTTAVLVTAFVVGGACVIGFGTAAADRSWSLAVASLQTRIPGPSLESLERVDGLIVLGGSVTRLREALRIAQRFPDAQLIVSGPAPHEEPLIAEALSVRSNVVVDRRPVNTYENAVFARELTRANADGCWLLVTSALHMPRAFGVFRALDFNVLAWPVDDTRHGTSEAQAMARHEVLALTAYWILNRTASLYPQTDPADRPASCSLPADAFEVHARR